MPAPAVSVLIPAYNAQGTIARAVESLKAQTMDSWEALIIADDATDYHAVLAAQGLQDTRLRFIATGGTATGVSHARNTGLAQAAAPIIAMLDADDRFYPDKLLRMLPMAETHGACACALRYMDYRPPPRELGLQGLRQSDAALSPAQYLQTHYAPNAMLVFDKTRVPGQWREDLDVMEDLLFSITAFNHIPAIYHINTPLHEYVFTPGSLSTAPQAPARFIAAKENILRQLDQGSLGIAGDEAKSALRHFVELSLQIEKEYALLQKQGSATSFTELLNARLAQAGRPITGV